MANLPAEFLPERTLAFSGHLAQRLQGPPDCLFLRLERKFGCQSSVDTDPGQVSRPGSEDAMLAYDGATRRKRRHRLYPPHSISIIAIRSEERRVGKGVDL